MTPGKRGYEKLDLASPRPLRQPVTRRSASGLLVPPSGCARSPAGMPTRPSPGVAVLVRTPAMTSGSFRIDVRTLPGIIPDFHEPRGVDARIRAFAPRAWLLPVSFRRQSASTPAACLVSLGLLNYRHSRSQLSLVSGGQIRLFILGVGPPVRSPQSYRQTGMGRQDRHRFGSMPRSAHYTRGFQFQGSPRLAMRE